MDKFQEASALRDSAALDRSGSSSAVSGGTSRHVAVVSSAPVDAQSGDAQSSPVAGAHVANSVCDFFCMPSLWPNLRLRSPRAKVQSPGVSSTVSRL